MGSIWNGLLCFAAYFALKVFFDCFRREGCSEFSCGSCSFEGTGRVLLFTSHPASPGQEVKFSCGCCSFEGVEQDGKTLEFDLAGLNMVAKGVAIFGMFAIFVAIGVRLAINGWGVPFIPVVWCQFFGAS